MSPVHADICHLLLDLLVRANHQESSLFPILKNPSGLAFTSWWFGLPFRCKGLILSTPGCGTENFCEVLPVLSAWIHSRVTSFWGPCPSQGFYPERKHKSLLLFRSTNTSGVHLIPSILTLSPILGQGRMFPRYPLMSTILPYPPTSPLSTSEHCSSLGNKKLCSYFFIFFTLLWVISISLRGRHLKFKDQEETLISFLKQPLPSGNEWTA